MQPTQPFSSLLLAEQAVQSACSLLCLGSGFPSFLLAGLVRTSPSSDRLSWSRGSGARDTFAPAGPKPQDHPGEEPGPQDSLDLHTDTRSPQSNMPLDASGATPEDTHTASQASAQALSEDELDAALLDLSSRAQLLPLAPKASSATVAIQDSDSEDLESWSVCSPQGQAASRGASTSRLHKWRILGPTGAPKQASQLLMPPNSPCLPGALPKPRPSAPVHYCPQPSYWASRPGAQPPAVWPKPAPPLRPRARSLEGPYQVSSLARKVPKLHLAAFRPPSSLLLSHPSAALRLGLRGRLGPSNAWFSRPQPRQPSARRQKCLATWMCLLQALGSASLLWTQIQHSSNAAEHTATAVRKFAVGTLETYLSLCLRFVDFCLCTSLDIATLSLAALADYLQACSESHLQDRSSEDVSLRQSKPSKPCPGYLV